MPACCSSGNATLCIVQAIRPLELFHDGAQHWGGASHRRAGALATSRFPNFESVTWKRRTVDSRVSQEDRFCKRVLETAWRLDWMLMGVLREHERGQIKQPARILVQSKIIPVSGASSCTSNRWCRRGHQYASCGTCWTTPYVKHI